MRTGFQIVLAGVVVAAMTVPVAAVGVEKTAFSVPLTPSVTAILPSSDQVVGVAHPVVVTFAAPVADRVAAEHSIEVKSIPAMTGKFDWTDANVVQWVPDHYWPAHRTVKVSVGATPLEFHTGPSVLGVASISQHTFTVTIDGAEMSVPVGVPAPHHLPHMGEAGVLPASMGRPEYSTPVGSYTVLDKERSVTMDSSSVGIPVTDPDGYRITVENAVRITRRGLFVHSAPWAVSAMGIENVSHGCISLSPAAAEWYFNTVNIGDPVIVQE